MTKAEYIMAKYWCNIKCTPIKEKCKTCTIYKVYKEMYKEEIEKGLALEAPEGMYKTEQTMTQEDIQKIKDKIQKINDKLWKEKENIKDFCNNPEI